MSMRPSFAAIKLGIKEAQPWQPCRAAARAGLRGLENAGPRGG